MSLNNFEAARLAKLRKILIDRSTGEYDKKQNKLSLDREYETIRDDFVIKCVESCPEFLVSCAALSIFWKMIRDRFVTYQARRDFINQELDKFVNKLKGETSAESK